MDIKTILDKCKPFSAEIVAIVLTLVALLWTYGCESTVRPLNGSPVKVTRAELETELNQFIALAEIRFRELDKQDEFKQILFNNAVIFAETGGINPLGVITSLAALFGIGATADNIRTRKKLAAKTIEIESAVKPTDG